MPLVRSNNHAVGFIITLMLCVGAMGSLARAERLPVRAYTTADGLPRDQINRIVQDSKGFLWFCTAEGLSRFDGYRFTNYGAPQGLPVRLVNDFLETRSGELFVATGDGLYRFNLEAEAVANHPPEAQQRFSIYRPSEDVQARHLTVLCEDHMGTIWCGTNAGLYRLDRIKGQWVFSFVNVIKPTPRGETRVLAILQDRRGALWISAHSGLYRLTPDREIEVYTNRNGLPVADSQEVLLEGHDGRIWVAAGATLYQLVADPQPDRAVIARAYTPRDGLPRSGLHVMLQSASGAFWLGSQDGLYESLPAPTGNGLRFVGYNSANGLSDPNVASLAEDREGNLWIGSESGGAMKLPANGFTTFDKTDGLGGIRISSIFESRAGELCAISGEGHINRFDGERFTALGLTLPKSITYWGWGWNQVMLEDLGGDWWMATGGGIVRYPRLRRLEQISNAHPKAIYAMREGLPASEVFRLFEDSRGDIWIATIGDPNAVLTRWERATGTFHRYSPEDGIPGNVPTAFCEDASGNLWIGFYLGGVLRYHAGRFTPFTSADGLPEGFIRAIYRDRAGRLWVAAGEGLARIDEPDASRPSFVIYNAEKGLSSNQATCVTEDRWGRIYIGTGRGIDRLDPATGQIKHYTTADGLANSFINVCFRDHQGALWFGTLQGLSRFVPKAEQSEAPPPILIGRLRVAGVEQGIADLGATNVAGLEFAPSQSNLQIEFFGLAFDPGELLRYQYKLDGADADWSPPTPERTVNYGNLAPGRYRFLVRAIRADGIASARPATVTFTIQPHLWQRWWFIILSMFFVTAVIYAVDRYRIKRIVELEQVRTRIATDLHDDIGSSLSQVSVLSEVVRHRVGADPVVAEPLLMIASLSRDLVEGMSDIVWAINPKRDRLADLTYRMRRFASDVFSARDIAFEFEAPDAAHDLRLGADVRREVFLIFKECVNNIARHSGCAEAQIAFRVGASRIQLQVSDDGRGFDSSQAGDGNGLVNIKQRAAKLGGTLEVISTIGKGTTVKLKAPVRRGGWWRR